LAEDGESLVRVEADFVGAVQAAAVVEPAVGAFDHPASRSGDEPAAGFRPGRRGPSSLTRPVADLARIAVGTLAQVPARHQRRTCLCAADQFMVKSCGWGYRPLAEACRHAHPVRSTYRMASTYSRQRSGGHSRPPCAWFGTMKPALRADAVSDSCDRYRRRRFGAGSHDSRC
jgi:hypothetical protein